MRNNCGFIQPYGCIAVLILNPQDRHAFADDRKSPVRRPDRTQPNRTVPQAERRAMDHPSRRQPPVATEVASRRFGLLRATGFDQGVSDPPSYCNRGTPPRPKFPSATDQLTILPRYGFRYYAARCDFYLWSKK